MKRTSRLAITAAIVGVVQSLAFPSSYAQTSCTAEYQALRLAEGLERKESSAQSKLQRQVAALTRRLENETKKYELSQNKCTAEREKIEARRVREHEDLGRRTERLTSAIQTTQGDLERCRQSPKCYPARIEQILASLQYNLNKLSSRLPDIDERAAKALERAEKSCTKRTAAQQTKLTRAQGKADTATQSLNAASQRLEEAQRQKASAEAALEACRNS